MGYTLMHEHMTIDLSRIKNDPDTILHAEEETIRELKELYTFGVRRILDVTNHGMGRDLAFVERLEATSGVEIVSTTGYYKDPFFPDGFAERTVEEIAAEMVRELKADAASAPLNRIKVIGEIGTSLNEWTPNEKKLFEAAVLAHKEIGALITTHTSLGTLGMEQIRFFEERNVDLSRVIIGHQDLNENEDEVIEIARRGATVGFDTIGKNNYRPDADKIETLLKLIDEGLSDRVVFSLDITRRSHLKDAGGIGYPYLFTSFLPLAREKGVSEEVLTQILSENPNRLLGEAPHEIGGSHAE